MKFENTTVTGIENAIIGLRLPMSKSFEDAKSKSDSVFIPGAISQIKIGDDDLRIVNNLLRADGCGRAGEPNSKFMRMIHVQVAITAPSYFMAELDTYKIGTVRNSTSVQHKGVSRAYSINDIEAFRGHYKRWSNYLPPIPNAKVFEVTFYKTMYNERAVYPKLRKQAKQWLIANGYNPNIN